MRLLNSTLTLLVIGSFVRLLTDCHRSHRPDLLIASATAAPPSSLPRRLPLVWPGGVIACSLGLGAVGSGVGELKVGDGAAVPFGDVGLEGCFGLLWWVRGSCFGALPANEQTLRQPGLVSRSLSR